MWDTDVCTNLIEGTPWIKHFAKYSQIGSVHSVMKSLPAPWHLAAAAWGLREEQCWECEGVGERPEQGGDKMPPKTGRMCQSQGPGRASSRFFTSWDLLHQQTGSEGAGDGGRQHLPPYMGGSSPLGNHDRPTPPSRDTAPTLMPHCLPG